MTAYDLILFALAGVLAGWGVTCFITSVLMLYWVWKNTK